MDYAPPATLWRSGVSNEEQADSEPVQNSPSKFIALVNDPSPADVRASRPRLNFEIANVTNYAIESSPHNDTGLTGARSDRLSSGEYPLHYDIAARQLFLSITVKIQPILSGLQV